MFNMVRRNSLRIIFLVALAAFLVACEPSSSGSSDVETATPDARPTQTPTPVPTPTPIPGVTIITADPIAETQKYLESLDRIEVQCAIGEIGSQRLAHLIRSEFDDAALTTADSDAISNCFSVPTVRSMFISAIEADTGGLSPRSRSCMETETLNLSPTVMFVSTIDTADMITLLRSVFCLNDDEREALGDSDSRFGFSEIGGIHSVECIIDRVTPSQYEPLVEVFTSGSDDLTTITQFASLFVSCGVFDDSDFEEIGGLSAVECVLGKIPMAEHGTMIGLLTSGQAELSELSEYLPTFIRCGVIEETAFEDAGLTSKQALCLIDAIGVEAIENLVGDSSSLTEDEVLRLLPVIGRCGIDIEALMDGDSERPGDPRFDHGLDPSDLPFTQEQNRCLLAELDDAGEDVWRNLGSGDQPTPELFAALAACQIDASDLAGPQGGQIGAPTPTPTTLITVELSFNQILTAVLTQTENDCLHTNVTAAGWDSNK
jgi:hypothetical protein